MNKRIVGRVISVPRVSRFAAPHATTRRSRSPVAAWVRGGPVGSIGNSPPLSASRSPELLVKPSAVEARLVCEDWDATAPTQPRDQRAESRPRSVSVRTVPPETEETAGAETDETAGAAADSSGGMQPPLTAAIWLESATEEPEAHGRKLLPRHQPDDDDDDDDEDIGRLHLSEIDEHGARASPATGMAHPRAPPGKKPWSARRAPPTRRVAPAHSPPRKSTSLARTTTRNAWDKHREQLPADPDPDPDPRQVRAPVGHTPRGAPRRWPRRSASSGRRAPPLHASTGLESTARRSGRPAARMSSERSRRW